MVEIHGNRNTINQRYHEHAMNKVKSELVKRELQGDYDEMFPCAPIGMGMGTSGFAMPGAGMNNFGMNCHDGF